MSLCNFKINFISSFGLQLVSAAVSQCFAGHGSKEELLTESDFMEWLLREPQASLKNY